MTSNVPFISVIVPAYNAMDVLEKCIDSIRRQTIPNLEIIIVDDGSTDNTGALAEKIALTDKRVRVIHKENGGSSSARNAGIEASKGEYLGFVDSDDFIEPLMYHRLLEAVTQENLLMAQTSRDEIAADGSRLPDVCIPPENAEIFDRKYLMRELLLHRGDASFCTRLTHRSLFEDPSMRFPEGELNEDFDLLTRMLLKVPEVAVLPWQDYHVYYRSESNSRTKDPDHFPRVFTDIVRNADRVAKLVGEEYPDLTEEAERFGYVQRLDYLLHIPVPLMRKDNEFYREVVANLKKNRFKAQKNRYLTDKEKKYILILGTAPKLARKIHKQLKGSKING
ncbi:MAG: glycosyltransferase [Lachnospiraceae bacterium]|nr:glycosyltransferase [Lachnospiraceae bacterium]